MVRCSIMHRCTKLVRCWNVCVRPVEQASSPPSPHFPSVNFSTRTRRALPHSTLHCSRMWYDARARSTLPSMPVFFHLGESFSILLNPSQSFSIVLNRSQSFSIVLDHSQKRRKDRAKPGSGKGGRGSKRERRGQTFPQGSSKEDALLTNEVAQLTPTAELYGTRSCCVPVLSARGGLVPFFVAASATEWTHAMYVVVLQTTPRASSKHLFCWG